MSARRRLALSLIVAAVCLPSSVALASPAHPHLLVGAHAATTKPTATASILTTPPQIIRASAKAGEHWKPGAAKYGVGHTLNQPIKGAGGTILRADVYYPTNPKTNKAAKGPFPVLLIQSPYGKSTAGASGVAASTGEDPYLVKHGYIDVVSDVRGTGDSSGQFGLFDPIQTKDSLKVLAWAAKRPHSDHKVGLYGASYLGIDQLQLAGAVGAHSPLKAIFPVVSATDLYRDTAFMGGILDAEFGAAYLGLTSGLNVINPVASPQNLAGLSAVEIQHLEDIDNFDAKFTVNALAGHYNAYDGSYWQSRQPDKDLANIVKRHIPAYLIGGEYDLFQRGEPMNYAALQNLADHRPQDAPMLPGQKVTGRYQLWDGPFTHLSGSAVNTDELELRWFDTWLKGRNTGMAQTKTPLHYYDLGTKSYDETTTYPFTGLRPTRYYLAPHQALSKTRRAAGTDTLIYSPTGNPCGVSVDQWAIGPVEAAQQIGGIGNLPCLQDDSATQIRPVVQTYTTPAMKQATTLGGPISATIYAKATTTDTTWAAEIEDVSPNGHSRPLTEGALLGSLRSVVPAKTWVSGGGLTLLPYHPYTAASATPVTPGKVTRYEIEIFPTLDTVAKGHKLRLTLTSSDAPHLQPSLPVTEKLVGGVYTIERTKSAPSSVEFPLGTVNHHHRAPSSTTTVGAKPRPAKPPTTSPAVDADSTPQSGHLPDTGLDPMLPILGLVIVGTGLGLVRRLRH